MRHGALYSISFFYKQLIVVVGTNLLALGVMSGVLYSNWVDEYKNNLIDVMYSKVTLLAATSRAALLFDDKLAANEILAILEQYPATRFAQIHDRDMQLFAEFKRAGEIVDLATGEFQQGAYFKNDSIYVSQRMVMGGEDIGQIIISADTDSLKAQQHRYALIAIAVFLGSFFLAYVLNWRLQKLLSAPVSELIGFVGYVAKQRKYHKRLEHNRKDEFGDLILGVNSMLDTIQEHEQQLFHRANFDELTQLPNRHFLMERLSHAINNAQRNKTEVALLFLDLDRFKVINDSLGHPVGDELLVQVAEKLAGVLRKSDSVCRWGGDEFVVLLENIGKTEDIDIIVRKIIEVLRKPSVIGEHQLHVSTSIGIARYPRDGQEAMSLLKHADISMYKAKGLGPGHYHYFESAMLSDSVQRLTLEMQVREAFEGEHFFLVYQPQILLESGRIIGFEALIRWKYGCEFVPPEQFLPILEEMGLMDQFSAWVLRQACTQNRQWQNAGLAAVRMAVNLPASFIIQPQSLSIVQAILDETGMAAQHLEIEITENTFIGSTAGGVPLLQDLKDLGVHIAVDDFGTGYSCMSYLRDLPVGTLKIDGSFVRGLGLSRADDGIVQSIITLGKSLGMTLVGECVETPQQLNMLKDMQCDIIQGYFYSEPLEVAAAAAFLKRHSTVQANGVRVKFTTPLLLGSPLI